jgi:hypothetical protein
LHKLVLAAAVTALVILLFLAARKDKYTESPGIPLDL